MMDLTDAFIGSPLYDNWFKKHYPEKSLVICSPYVKKDALEKIISLYGLDTRGCNFSLKVLIRGNREEFTYQKSSDISIFDSLFGIEGFAWTNVRRIKNLHMKAYLIDEKHLLITSGNLTNSGLFVISGKENFEGGISTQDPAVFMKFMNYFSSIWNQAEPLNAFYNELLVSYTEYIKNEYTDRQILQRLNRERYRFPSHTSFDCESSHAEHAYTAADTTESPDIPLDTLSGFIAASSLTAKETPEPQLFSLSDIPPVGTLEHVPEVLRIISEYPYGISYHDLGRRLRETFGEGQSDTGNANRKFGEEKGKFAAFLNLAVIINQARGKLVKISALGDAYLKMSDVDRNKVIKDVFFDKPIVVSIMRQSMETPDFNLTEFLIDNCFGATETTLYRKTGPLKDLFNRIRLICTEDELQSALYSV